MRTLETRGMGRRELQPPLRRGEPAVENKALAALVLEAVRLVEDEEMNPPAHAAGAAAFGSRMMLAMLTYCYITGACGSEDVEQMMYEDAGLRALCGMEYPDWKRVKRFRRDNHAALRRTLEETLRSLWRLNGDARHGSSGNGLPDPAQEEWVANEAQARLDRAMFIDLMAVE